MTWQSLVWPLWLPWWYWIVHSFISFLFFKIPVIKVILVFSVYLRIILCGIDGGEYCHQYNGLIRSFWLSRSLQFASESDIVTLRRRHTITWQSLVWPLWLSWWCLRVLRFLSCLLSKTQAIEVMVILVFAVNLTITICSKSGHTVIRNSLIWSLWLSWSWSTDLSLVSFL